MVFGIRNLLSREQTLPRRRQLHEGSTKTLFDGPEPGTHVLHFKDLLSNVNQANQQIPGKGAINNRLSEMFMARLNELGIATHFVKRLNMSEQLVLAAEVMPFDATIHNVAVDDLSERLNVDNYFMLAKPIIEFSAKSSTGQMSILSPQHLESLGMLGGADVDDIMAVCQRVNDFLNGQFFAVGLRLLNCRLRFGRVYKGDFSEESGLLLIDEISPDSCAILDFETGERLDGLVTNARDQEEFRCAYETVASRFGMLTAGGPLDLRDTVSYVNTTTDEEG